MTFTKKKKIVIGKKKKKKKEGAGTYFCVFCPKKIIIRTWEGGGVGVPIHFLPSLPLDPLLVCDTMHVCVLSLSLLWKEMHRFMNRHV